MELDTGSRVSVISLKSFNKLFPKLKLEKSKMKLSTYTGQEVPPKGVATVSVVYKGYKHKLKLYVVDGVGPPLFGRRLSKFNF